MLVPMSSTPLSLAPDHRQPSQLVGRAELLQELKSLTAAPTGSVLLLTGAPGIGKTAVMDKLQSDLDPAPAVVLVNGSETGRSFSGVHALLAAFEITGVEGTDEVGSALATGEAGDDPFQVARLVGTFCKPETAIRRVVLIDDVDAMDRPSLEVLGHLSTRAHAAGITLICAATEVEAGGPLSGWPARELRPLDFDEALTLAGDLAGPGAQAAVLRTVVGHAEGVPRAVRETLELLPARQLNGWDPMRLPLRMGTASTRAAAQGLDRLDERARRFVELLATAQLTPMEALMRTDPAAVDLVSDLIDDGWIEVNGSYLELKPAIRSYAYWEQGSQKRREAHEALAAACEGFDDRLTLWHGTLAGARQATAVELLGAAESFIREGWPVPGLELIELALRRRLANPEATAALINVCHALVLTGRLSWVRRYVHVVSRSPGNEQHPIALETLRMEYGFLLNLTAPQRGLQSTLRVAEDGSASPTEAAECAHAWVLASLFHAVRWEASEALAAAAGARGYLDVAEPSSRYLQDGNACLVEALQGRAGAAERAYESIMNADPGDVPPQTLVMVAVALTHAGHYGECRAVLSRFVETPNHAETLWMDISRFVRVENELRAGNISGAFSAIELIGTMTDSEVLRPYRWLYMTWYWFAKDRSDLAEAYAVKLRTVASPESHAWLVARLSSIEGGFAALTGDYELAVRKLLRAASLTEFIENPELKRLEPRLIELLVLTGQEAEAAVRCRDFQQRVARFPSKWSRMALARSRAALMRGQDSLDVYAQAVRTGSQRQNQYELAPLMAAYARRLHEYGQVDQAHETLRTAKTLYREVGATTWAEHLTLDGAAGGDPIQHPLMAQLSADERAVVERVIQGRRNKEIAAELFVSLRTVEVRLTKVYRKLGARTRAHLTAMLSNGHANGTANGNGHAGYSASENAQV
ncbi:LuxR C-terminal-related transcriptional regulator [Zafaria sp. J156]|nr:LuxR C-terminal-related transcriptional regulator [Zafaria sp. J156]